MYLLDTNVVSMLDPRRHQQSPSLVTWIGKNAQLLFMSVVSLVEMERGVLKLKRNRKLARAGELKGILEEIVLRFGDRLLPVNAGTALRTARLAELTHRQPVELPNLIIAATAIENNLILLTRNKGDFTRLAVKQLDPFEHLPPSSEPRS
jgi:predicted nucleic acid-binding protein